MSLVTYFESNANTNLGGQGRSCIALPPYPPSMGDRLRQRRVSTLIPPGNCVIRVAHALGGQRELARLGGLPDTRRMTAGEPPNQIDYYWLRWEMNDADGRLPYQLGPGITSKTRSYEPEQPYTISEAPIADPPDWLLGKARRYGGNDVSDEQVTDLHQHFAAGEQADTNTRQRARETIMRSNVSEPQRRKGLQLIDDLPADVVADALLGIASAAPLTLLDRLRARKSMYAETALPTGVLSLDLLLEFGGIPLSKNLVVGGAPDAGKTALVLQMVEHMASKGAAVGWCAVDEDAEDIDSRRVQSLGIPRKLAAGAIGPRGLNEHHVAQIEAARGASVFLTFEGGYVEDVFRKLAELYPDRPRVVVLDSLQTGRSRRSERCQSPRERVDTLLADIKAAQQQWPALPIVTTELNRAAYRNRDQSENVDPMAAAKETGGIEYFAKCLLILRSEGEDVVSVEIPKSKIGRKEPFRLKLDRATLTFSAAPETSLSSKAAEVLAAVRKVFDPPADAGKAYRLQTEGLGIEQIKTRVRKQGVTFPNGPGFFHDVLDTAIDEGWLHHDHRAKCYLPVSAVSATATAPPPVRPPEPSAMELYDDLGRELINSNIRPVGDGAEAE